MNRSLLSVCLITYNQVGFFRQAIESVLTQKVDFSWEIIIADDCSTDGTSNLVNEYQKKYPELIKTIIQKKNVGAAQNFLDLLGLACGEYIAYLECDDYWTDTEKLKKQIDFLERNNQFEACFHNVAEVDTVGEKIGMVYDSNRLLEIGLADLVAGDYLKSCSLLFRNNKKKLLPMFNKQLPAEDTSLGYCLLQDGQKAVYSPEVMAVYRVHSGGTWSMIQTEKRFDSTLKNLLQYRIFFKNDKAIYKEFRKMMRSHLQGMLFFYLKSFKIAKACGTFLFFFRYAFF
jgi:glycosyltransferase involved in cell wall biosynthesis